MGVFQCYVGLDFNPLSASSTKWSNTLKQSLGCSRRIVRVRLTVLWELALKGYLRHKSIFCHKVALDVKLIFLIWRKNVSFSRYLDFYVFVKFTNYTFAYSFWILRSIKMKFGQMLVYPITNIFSMFLAQCWRLETNSRLFMILMKWHYNEVSQFSVVDIYHF